MPDYESQCESGDGYFVIKTTRNGHHYQSLNFDKHGGFSVDGPSTMMSATDIRSYLDFSYQLDEKLLSITFSQNSREIYGVEAKCVKQLQSFFIKHLVDVEIRMFGN